MLSSVNRKTNPNFAIKLAERSNHSHRGGYNFYKKIEQLKSEIFNDK